MMGSMIFLHFHLVVSLLTKHDADMPRDLNGQQNNENDYLRRFSQSADSTISCGVAEYQNSGICEHCGVIGESSTIQLPDDCDRAEYTRADSCDVKCAEGGCAANFENDDSNRECQACPDIASVTLPTDCIDKDHIERPKDGNCSVTCMQGGCAEGYQSVPNTDTSIGGYICEACESWGDDDLPANCSTGEQVTAGVCTVTCMDGGCANGYESSSDDSSCQACDASEIPSDLAITDCEVYQYLDNGVCNTAGITCSKCIERYERETTDGASCTHCDELVTPSPGISNCSAYSPTNAISSGNYLDPGVSCEAKCVECEPGYELSSDGAECTECSGTAHTISGCSAYSKDESNLWSQSGVTCLGKCVECIAGHAPSSDGDVCEVCSKLGCSEFNYTAPGVECSEICTSCSQGYSLDNDGEGVCIFDCANGFAAEENDSSDGYTCEPCPAISSTIDHCQDYHYAVDGDCDEEEITCIECESGEKPSADGSLCETCPYGPESYAADGRPLMQNCVARSETDYLHPGVSCTAACVTCESGYGSDSAGTGCDVCDTSALNCQQGGVNYPTPGDCSGATCDDGFCNNGYVSDSAGTGCDACITADVAATLFCKVSGVTYTTDLSDDGCAATCDSGSCLAGYESNPANLAECIACDTSALNCQSGGVYYPNPGSCLRAFCSADQCESGYVSNFSGGCESCPLQCAECYYDRLEFSTSCRQCDDGYGYDDDGQCRSCSPGLPGLYNPRELQGCDCSVIDHCVECDEDDQHQCQTCADGYGVWDSFSGEKYECVKKTDGGGKTEGSNTWIYSLVAGVFLFILLIFILFLVVKARNNAEAAEGTPQSAI